MTLSYDKILRRAALCMLMLLMTGACSRRGPVLTFREADDPTADTLADWSGVASGLHAAWGTTDKRYARSVVPCAAESECRLTAWRGERVSAQLVLWSVDSVGGVECRIGKFRSDGACLPAGIAQARFVRYVLTDTFGPGCGHRKDGDFPVSLAADMLDTLGRFDMDARTARPVWLTVSVPDDAPAGVYRSCVEVMGCGVKSLELPLELRVQERRLPRPAEWSYHLDLWQHPAAAARVMGLALWSDAHFDALRPLVRMLADAGQKVVTATLNKDPWNHQCFDAYEDMIRWTKRADGTWVYDYSLFDRWVGLCAGEGIDRQINCYSMLPWNNMLHYKDAVTGEFVDVKADPGTPAFREMWGPFLPAFVGHLREKGWLGITNIAMDERSPEVMAAATALLKEVAPELGIALADNHKIFKQYPYIKDMCASIFGPIEQTDIVQRRSKGLTTTFYVCCSSGFPNTYTSSAPAEATYLSWYAAAEDYDGFLRWAYNSWVEDPIRDSRFRKWAAGDTYLVYPEGRSSIRFERLVEGIQDWEKIRLLKTEFSGDDAKLQTLHDLLEPFRSSVAFDGWEQTLRNARATLNTL